LEEEESKEYLQRSPIKSQEEVRAVVDRNKSKLERLLAQTDIFDCLRRINQGLIKSYDDLGDNHQTQQLQAVHQSRRVTSNRDEEVDAPKNSLVEI
jgi:hypothetical protein